MSTTLKLLLAVSYIISGAIVYSRNYRLSRRTRILISSSSILVLIYCSLTDKALLTNRLVQGLISAPIVIMLLYELFDLICWKINKRGFHLHTAGAKDMKGLGLPSDNSHYKWIDIAFSVILILTWVSWPMLYIVIMHFIS